MVITSAPGKVILFGEHAVVYGEPSLVAAIDKRIYVSVEKREDSTISINSDLKADFKYVKKAAELVFSAIEENSGLEINISSELPPAAGLGSSAAVSVATILAVSKLFEKKLTKKQIAELGHKTELEVQSAASPTDTAISTFGGILYVRPKRKKFTPINASLPLIIGYTGIERSTKVLVENVRMLKDKYPKIVNLIIKSIGRITKEAKMNLEQNKDIGELMNMNHALLEALGVSNEKLSRAVYAARSAGAKGAKLTGAGGGGCVIAYAPENQEAVIKAIESTGCTAVNAVISKEGVRVEK